MRIFHVGDDEATLNRWCFTKNKNKKNDGNAQQARLIPSQHSKLRLRKLFRRKFT